MCIRDSNNQIIVSNPPSIVQNQNHIHVQNQNQLQVNHTLVNAVLNPIQSYFNPLSHILSNSEVEQGLENIFKLESLGIEGMHNNKSEDDLKQIEKFKGSIDFKDRKYHLDLPCIEDKLPLLPSNYNIALAVLN